MQRIFALAAVLFAAFAAAEPATTTTIKPGAVTSAIAPPQSPPPGCSPNYDGTFEIGPINVTSSKRSVLGRRGTTDTQLGITLKNGILTDPLGRTGYIASNEQFQFDGPPQAGAIWTAGFSICENGSLALGSDVIWWKCLSGTFYNLYFKSIGGQCIESYIIAYGVDGGHPGSVPASLATETSTGSAASSSSSSATAASSASSSATAAAHHSTKTATAMKPSKTQANASSASSAASSATSAAAAMRTNSFEGAIFGLAGGLAALAMM